MKCWRVYHVEADRSLTYRCSVLASAAIGAVLRARGNVAVDGRRRIAVIEEGSYDEFGPSPLKADGA